MTAEEADACTLEILEAIDVDKDGDVTKVSRRTIYILIYIHFRMSSLSTQEKVLSSTISFRNKKVDKIEN